MGMYSWCCKGCGHELKEGEYVRLNGCVGEYDGYGNAGGFSYNSDCDGHMPSGWHVRCYNNATVEQKLDNSGSNHAPNQGFGLAALENKKGYSPDAETIFQAGIVAVRYDSKTNKSTRQEWYIVGGVLADQCHYETLYAEANKEDGFAQKLYDSRPDNFYEMSRDDQTAFYRMLEETIDDHIGMKRPCANAEWYNTFEEAKSVAESLIGTLPNPDWGYELAIYGKQEYAEGLYYKFNKIPNFNVVDIPGEFYDHGGAKIDFVYDGTFKEEIAFMHNRPASADVMSY